MKRRVLLYGAYGYSGKLILNELLSSQTCRPLIAGRNSMKTEQLAEAYKLEFEVVEAADFAQVLNTYPSIELVINAAGPYLYTASPIARACIENGVHYIDITGEVGVFSALHEMNADAKAAGVMVLPGAGFDVAATDCLASALKAGMPDANDLEMGFAQVGSGISRGTLLTSIISLDTKTLIRKDGKMKAVSWQSEQKEIDFGPFKRHCVAIPWGDLVTAPISAGYDNVKVFMPMRPDLAKRLPWLTKLLQIAWLKRLILWHVGRTVTGPADHERESSVTHVVGRAKNAKGDEQHMRLETSGGYTFTARCTAWVTRSILDGKVSPGFQTPSTAYGYGFIKAIKDVNWNVD